MTQLSIYPCVVFIVYHLHRLYGTFWSREKANKFIKKYSLETAEVVLIEL